MVEAKIDADSAFETFGQMNQKLKQQSDAIAAQLTEQHSEEMDKLEAVDEKLEKLGKLEILGENFGGTDQGNAKQAG